MSIAAELDTSSGQPPRKPRYQAMLLALVPFAIGILLDRFFDLPVRVWGVVWVVACITWFVSFQRTRRSNHQSADRWELTASLCLMIALAAMGGFWQHGRWNWHAENQISGFAEREPVRCALRATLIREPRKTIHADRDSDIDPLHSPERTRLRVQATAIRDGRDWRPVGGVLDVVVYAPIDHVKVGDQLQVSGKLFGLKPPTNPGQFDFQNYLRSQGRFATVVVYLPESVAVRRPAQRQSAAALLSHVRQRLNAVAWRLIDADEAGFASAILLGNREQLTRERRSAFLETGTAHLLAISGLHVGILAASVFFLFRFGLLSRQKCLVGTILFVIAYAWLVEFRPTVVRAAILISLHCIGRLSGHRGYSFNLLAVAAWLVLLLNPSDLLSVGPQLSFLAVATLAFAKDCIWWPRTDDPLQKLIAKSRPYWWRGVTSFGRGFRATALASAMIWLSSVPLVAWHFHLVAPVGLVLNPLLLLPIAVGLYAGAATLLLGTFADWPAELSAWLCQQTLHAIEHAITVAQAVPIGHFWTAGPPLVSLIVFYTMLFLFAVFPPTRLPKRWIACISLCWCVFGWLLPNQASQYLATNSEQAMACTFVDVGHGTSVLVELPQDQHLLYDCGSFGSSLYGLQNVSSVLWSRRIEHIDAVVISHADIDHFNSLADLSERFSIGAVYVSPQMLGSVSPAVTKTLERLRERQIPIRPMIAGYGSESPNGWSLEALSPITQRLGSTDNADSLVLQIKCGNRSVLLPGDLEAEGLAELLARPAINCDVLMLAHHGSRNSLPADFVAWAQPDVVVASCGRGRLTEDVVESMDRLDYEFYRTDLHGAVRVRMDADTVTVQTYREGCWSSEQHESE